MEELNATYGAILIDAEVFIRNGLRLEKGLLRKLYQFKKSPVTFLFPDVIKNEVKNSRAALEKSLNDAGDHLFFEGSDLNDAKQILIDSQEIEGLAESRLANFIAETGALVLDCGKYVSVKDLLCRYFSASPPFAKKGKKKHEFPDAIALMAVEAWAKENDVVVLAVTKDGDWKQYCDCSEKIDYREEIADALAIFNSTNAPYALLLNLEKALVDGEATHFLAGIELQLEYALSDLTPAQEAESSFSWEPEGCYGSFKEFYLVNDNFRIIDQGEDWVVLEAIAVITIEAEGEFSFSVYDSIDKDDVYLGSLIAKTTEEFESEILITVVGNLEGPIEELSIDEVEVVNSIGIIDFGLVEPDFGDPDYDE